MAQKKAVAAKGKNAVEKPAKRGAKAVQPQEEEEELVAQSPAKKGKKLPVKEVPQSSEEDSDDEEQNGGEEEDDSDSQAEDAGDLIDDEAEEDDEEDDSDEDEDELEPGQASLDNLQVGDDDDDDSEDEAPVEEPVSKKAKGGKQANGEESDAKKGGIPKIRVGKIPSGTPKENIIFGSNLPQGKYKVLSLFKFKKKKRLYKLCSTEYTHKDVVALFTKFGPISILNRITDKKGQNKVIIAFETAAGAEAALAAKDKALTLGGKVVAVSQLRNKDESKELTVVVGLIGSRVTPEEIKAHFGQIGPVEAVTKSNNKANPKAFVRYTNASDAEKALKLHSTEFFSRFITVRPMVFKANSEKTPETTLILENVGKHESYSSDAIEKIFKKFDVSFTDVVCSKMVLAFITFKKPEGATNALAQLGGKTVNNLELKLSRFQRTSSGRAILVTNLATETTEDQLKELFGENGDIESVQMLGHKAVIKFSSDDAFCKSFLLNEQVINNQPLFIEPNSLLKHRLNVQKAGRRNPPGAPPAKKFAGNFQKNGNNKSFGGKKPFNKRPYQENGAAKPFVKRPRF
ncbi:hypothetical protein KR054_009069 [Drosophila jambulina]|nr:hypothetical protein KR054_009069 [Drosophila jambulina]